jgi:hypothetical protein
VTGSAIFLEADLSAYFREVVSEAVRLVNIGPSEEAVSYLVALLCDFARPGWSEERLLERPLTFRLRDALATGGTERFGELRRLGDEVLYSVGFFTENLSRRGADPKYVMGLGATAYEHAAAMLRLGGRPVNGKSVLDELAARFERFVRVLNEVADCQAAEQTQDPAGLVRLYELWRRSGSERLAKKLQALGVALGQGARRSH